MGPCEARGSSKRRGAFRWERIWPTFVAFVAGDKWMRGARNERVRKDNSGGIISAGSREQQQAHCHVVFRRLINGHRATGIPWSFKFPPENLNAYSAGWARSLRVPLHCPLSLPAETRQSAWAFAAHCFLGNGERHSPHLEVISALISFRESKSAFGIVQ